MSYEYDEHDDAHEGGPKALRDLVKKLQKDLDKVTEERDGYAAKAKAADLSTIFTTKNVPPSIQRWIKKDGVEPTAEAVDQWLAENGEDFGWKPGSTAEKPEGQESAPEEAPAAAQSVLTPEDVAAGQRIQQISSTGVGQTVMSDQVDAAVAAVESATGPNASFNDVVKALAAQGIDIQSHFG